MGPRRGGGRWTTRCSAGWRLGRVRSDTSSDGLQIAYQVVGDGPVDVVFVPGLANHIEALWYIPELS
ncbi:MAG TPA: hypothetical protein VGN51_10290, partial [Acidimicrobiia bacterium]